MNRTILYYPTINIPSEGWLRHALLYWDEVSSIVPQSHDDEMLSELSPDIHYLISEEQFRAIKPEDLIFKKDNWEAFDQFQQEFQEIVLSPQFTKFIQNRAVSTYKIHTGKVDADQQARVHSNKTSDSIFYQLEQLGLAKRDAKDHKWLIFEKNTALLYMSLLAKYLADIDSNQTTIGTDDSSYEGFNFKRVTEDEGFPVVNISLDSVLPSPKEGVPLEKIIDFKRKRMDNLLHFKKTLSDFQSKISKAQSQAEFKENAINFQENLLIGVKDLTAVLSDSKIEIAFKTLKSLINLKSPTTIAAAGALINSHFDLVSIPLNWATIGISTLGAIELTSNFIDVRNKNRAKLRESPFSYIYFAQQAGIVSNH